MDIAIKLAAERLPREITADDNQKFIQAYLKKTPGTEGINPHFFLRTVLNRMLSTNYHFNNGGTGDLNIKLQTMNNKLSLSYSSYV